MRAKVKTIDIQAKEWFDKVNGNSYFSAQVTVNFGLKSAKTFYLPFQYGYGGHYKDMAMKELNRQGVTSAERYWDLQDQGVIVRASKQENCLQRDVKSFGASR